MRTFDNRLAVVTGAGSGIGRALAERLVAEGCHVALCDLSAAGLAETLDRCRAVNDDVRASTFTCDVTDEEELHTFARRVAAVHGTDHIHLLVNNAGISGGGSFVNSPRSEWERVFDVCWRGVYLTTRAFQPMLEASPEGHLVNVASANALRAVLGGQIPHTAYSAAKFAVRGFSEALIHDFRFNAPHLKVSLVLPGHTATGIVENSADLLGLPPPDPQDLGASKALGMTPEAAADVILDGVRHDRWRILIGTDTESLDALVRDAPEAAYDPDFVLRWREANARLGVSRDDP